MLIIEFKHKVVPKKFNVYDYIIYYIIPVIIST